MIQNIKRAQNNLNKCHDPIGVWSESYRHEIRLTAELMLLSARIGRGLLSTRRHSREHCLEKKEGLIASNQSVDVEPNIERSNKTCEGKFIDSSDTILRRGSDGLRNLQPTFRTDVANK